MSDADLFTDEPAPGSDLFTDEPAPKSLGGFAQNLVSNAGRALNPVNIAEGLGSTLKEGLYDIPKAMGESSVDLLKGTAKAVTGGGLPEDMAEAVRESPIIKKTAEMTEPIAKDPVGYAYKNPIDAAMLAATPYMAWRGIAKAAPTEEAASAPKIPLAEAVAPVAEAPKELPIMQPGAKTGAPHALLAYEENLGEGIKPRWLYNIYGDPNSPAIKERAWGSSVPKEDLAKSGIPITGREPRSVKFGLPPEEAPNAPKAPNTIGQRLAARTTSQALDINPLAARKLAAKAGVSPEEVILDLGNKANELIPDLIEPMDSANSKFSKILNAHDDAGKQIGKIVDNATKGTQGAFPEAGETIGALRTAAENYYQVDGGDLALQKTAERLEKLQKAGQLDFDRLSQVKSAIGKGFNKTEAPPGTEEIYGILNDGIDKVINRLGSENPSLGENFSRLKQIYTVTSRLLPAMSRTAAREVAGTSVGGGVLSKMIPSAIGGVIGGVPGAVLAGGAKYLQEAIAPDLGKNLAYMAMKAKPELVAAVRKAMPTLSETEAAAIASRISNGKKEAGMYKGGLIPKDVRDYVGSSRSC